MIREGTMLLLVSLASAVSCAPSPGTPGEGASSPVPTASEAVSVYFPVMRAAPDSPRPAALIEGRLKARDGCLWLERELQTGVETYLVLWESGTHVEDIAGQVSVITQGGSRIALGERIRAGGGETRDLQQVVDLIGSAPPPRCQTGEAYWRAYDISPARQ